MNSKKQIRADFRKAVFERDRYRCVMCGKPGKDRQGGDAHLKYHPETDTLLDSHHITNRSQMPGGGYVAENGVTVCDDCHLMAENGTITSTRLYEKIGSSYEEAVQASTARVF